MSITKKIFSIFLMVMVVCSSFSMFSLSASAAKTSAKNVVSYNAVAGGTISSQTYEYNIKSNFFTKKKITIYGSNSFPNKTVANSFSSLARFDITVKDKNGKTINSYTNKSLGFKFYLPAWKVQNYKIIVTSKFSGYKWSNAYHAAAAINGKYYLKY